MKTQQQVQRDITLAEANLQEAIYRLNHEDSLRSNGKTENRNKVSHLQNMQHVPCLGCKHSADCANQELSCQAFNAWANNQKPKHGVMREPSKYYWIALWEDRE